MVNKNGKKIKLDGIKGLKIQADNGSGIQKLSISGNEASGTIKLTGSTTYVTVESIYDGYFQKKSRIYAY